MTKPRGVFLRATCPTCGKELPVRPPRGGDGSVDVFPRHIDMKVGSYCPSSRADVRKSEYVAS